MSRLTERDLAVFKEFLDIGPLTAKQMVALGIFPHEKKARDRIKLLHEEGYVDYCSKPYFGRGRAEHVFYLNQKKVNGLLSLLGCSREQIGIMKPSAYSPFLLHHLAITDFIICVRVACEHSGVYEAAIIPEYKQLAGKVRKLKKSITQSVVVKGVDVELIPDGLICLSLKQETAKSLLFFEIYRGTQIMESSVRQSIQAKLEAYVAYWEQGLYKNFADIFSYNFKGFRVLLIVEPVSYLEKLEEICQKAPVGLFWLALSGNISPNTFFKPIWHISGETGLKALVREAGNNEKTT